MSYQRLPWLNTSTFTINGTASISTGLVMAPSATIQAPYISTLNVQLSTLSFVNYTNPGSTAPLYMSANSLYFNTSTLAYTSPQHPNFTSGTSALPDLSGTVGIVIATFPSVYQSPPTVVFTPIKGVRNGQYVASIVSITESNATGYVTDVDGVPTNGTMVKWLAYGT